MSNQFVHLHTHSEFSVLDGLGKVDHYVERAKELGQSAIALTDHGVLCGAPEFYKAARAAGVEPILGQEFYYVEDSTERPAKGEKQKERHHVVMLAKGERGYELLAQLSTEAHKRYYYKPLIDRALLDQLGDDTRHLVVLSGCAASAISWNLREGSYDKAVEELIWWRERFPHFYIELQHHGTDFDKRLNEDLVDLARRYQLPWVVTNDPHYVVEEDADHHDVLLAIQTASDVDDPARFRFDGGGYHLKSRAEMRRAFRRYGDDVWRPAAAETIRIARACRTRIGLWERRTWLIPRHPDVAPDAAFDHLRRLALDSLAERGLDGDPEYVRRTRRELKVIKKAGIASFLLITKDAIDYAKSVGIPVGPGRGSVCGTLVGYLIGLHKIDSIRYDLMFERFLNPARPRMPDIDTDFGQARRMEMFEYARQRYGEDNVVHVAAYDTMKMSKCFQTLGKAHGIPYPDRLRLTKLLDPSGEGEEVLPEEIRDRFPGFADQLERLQGTRCGIHTHPAGVIIADPEHHIRSLVPEMWIASTKKFVGQYDLEAVEHMGLMKQDFLGLRTLDTIAECVRFIKERYGEDIDPDSWVPDEEEGDADVYAMLAKGQTAGVFQMEGPTNQRGCREVNPESFEDLVSITSLYRTGPIRAGYPKKFNANRKHGRRKIEYYHPMLRPILERTWGVILYQEQVMEIGEVLAGFDAAQVDDIKEAIKHKKSKLMEEMRPVFIKGCKETSGISSGVARQIWKDIEGYSGYSYNRSHAVAYTFLTYQTARLKCLYPLEFLAALLATVDDKDKRDAYLREAIERGFRIVPPDINRSEARARPEGRRTIRFGLADLSGIGEKAAEKALGARPRGGYTDAVQVAEAVRNKGTLEALREGKALETLGVPGDDAACEARLNWQFRDPMVKWRKRYGDRVQLPEYDGQYVTLVGQIFKTDMRKTKDDKPYCTWKIRWSTTESFDIRLWSECQELFDLKPGSIILVSGKWEQRWMNLSIGDPARVRVIKALHS